VYISDFYRRSRFVFLLFFIFFCLSIARLFFIQIFRSNYLADIAKKQHNLFVELEPRRGTIYDCNLRPQASNIPVDSVYASPNEIPDKNKDKIISQLSPILNVSHEYLKDRLYRKKSFVWLGRKITPQQSEAIRNLHIKGIDFIKESRRSYSNGYLGAQVIGFAGLDNVGLEGLEMYYDSYLKGESGWALFLRDARQKKLNLYEKIVPPKDGYDIVLTIDEVIQYIAEKELEKAIKKHNAKGGSIVVMDPHTGEILALANRPTFDPNDTKSRVKDSMSNRAICDLFEPGSVFKIVTASAALEEQKANESDRIFCENGAYRVASHILHDHRAHGWLTFREVIEQSSNIGTTKIAQNLGDSLLYRYVKAFGFGVKTGVDLPGEINGMAKEPRFWSKTSIGAVPIGQEIGVTTLQLACAISVIANGGQLMRPFIVKEIIDKYKEPIKEFEPVMAHKVISLNTAERVKSILRGVIESGTGKMARIQEFSAAGKTGTAQKIEPNGAYSHTKFMATFIGFAPVDDPMVAIAVVIDEPRPYYFGGVVAAPVFKDVACDTLKYLNAKISAEETLVLNEVNRVN